jgi:hypothetical protein
MPKFLSDYSRLSTMIHENFCSYRVFFAPATKDASNIKIADEDVLISLEKSIIHTLDVTEGNISKFLSNKERYKNYKPSQSLLVRFKSKYKLHGLEQPIEI